ncbi:hypothetical protein KAW65_00110 [candidate division WOR-3 bacterium]|nr:hypothetical protein [candidate division WOR-3 bacterium]
MSSNSPIIDSGLSNPFSTGGGGTTFEQLVGTYYLVSLLASEAPRGLDSGVTKEIKLQHRWSGCLLDDIVITSTNGSEERKLALQVKKDLVFSDTSTNTTFARVIDDCWKTFSGSLGWQFNPDADRIGIGIGTYQSKLDKHFKSLLEWARTSKNSAEFIRKVNLSKFSSHEKQEYLTIIRNLLNKSAGKNITDDELWKFLKCLVVLHFDLESPGSRDATYCWNQLLNQLKVKDTSQAKLLFSSLTSIVSEYARSAGCITRDILKGKLPVTIALKEQVNYIPDLNRLREHTDRVLNSINIKIGNKVQLPRTELLDKVTEAIKKYEIIVLIGEPMTGKSALLRLLANRLRGEGKIMAISVERLFGSGLENFLSGLQIKSSFQTILGAIGTAPLRCILIDGLERALNENKRRVLNDLILEVQRYNEKVAKSGGHKEYHWKIVFTCRSQEAQNILLHLETRQNLVNKTLERVEISALSDDEIEEVVNQLPKLKDLTSREYLKELLSRPLVLDILTLPEISLQLKSLPPILTETWLLDWFWKEVVHLAEGTRPGRGNPDKREQLLISVGKDFLTTGSSAIDISMDSEALSGLISDKLLTQEDNHIKFAHDVLEDWTLTMLISQNKGNIIGFLKQFDESLYLVRPFRLFASRLLEVSSSPKEWMGLLTTLESDNSISPRWYQTALTAPLFSPLLPEILSQIEKHLFENECLLLAKLLNALRIICVQPSSMAYAIFPDLPQREFEKYLAYWTVPVWPQWFPIIKLVVKNRNKLGYRAFYEFSEVSQKWMTNTEGDKLLRKEIAKLCLELLDSKFIKDTIGTDDIRNNLIKSVLWAADCLPDIVEGFVKDKVLRKKNSNNYGFEELILKEGWIPLCKYLPQTAVEIIEKILCKEIKPDRFGSYYPLFMDLGIGHTGWNPPTYLKGPYLGLLRMHPDEGIKLITKVINHATNCWNLREEEEWNKHPIPQIVKLNSNEIEVYGDEHVYHWYRYPSVAPDAITCGLMALEYWMNEQIKNRVDPLKLFEKVLKDSSSVAIIGVCASVALANYKVCREAILPILENPAFWIMDIYRVTQDITAENSVNIFSTYFSLGGDKSDYNILLKLAKESQRKLDIRNFVLPILLQGPKKAATRLQNAMCSFPENPPFLFEEEKKNASVVEYRKETCRIWAAQAERKNYKVSKSDVNSYIQIQFKLPTEFEETSRKLQLIEERQKVTSLLVWSLKLLDENILGTNFTLESAMKFAKKLVKRDNPLYQPKNFLEDSEERANAIAAFTASLVLRQWDWVEKNNYKEWCGKQLLIAANRPEPPEQIYDEVSRFSCGYRRSSARALPILLSKAPRDTRMKKAIIHLAHHRNEEVRAYLFNSLKALWEVLPKIIWSCINVVVKRAMIVAQERYLKYIGKKSTKITKIRHNLNARKKNLQDIILWNTGTDYLKSILYALPSGDQIAILSNDKKLLGLMENLLHSTVKTYIHCQKKNTHYNEWAYRDWNHLFFPIIANALLQLPKEIAKPKFLNPILEHWEKAPALMEEFLRQLSLVGTYPELEPRLIELWHQIGDKILSSSLIKSLGYYLHNDMRNILGLLIFSDPTGIVKWKVKEWSPLKETIKFIERWCQTVGHHPDCFPSLVRLLRTIGFNLMPEFGIKWLHACLSERLAQKNFFERSRVTWALAELLHDSYSEQKDEIMKDPETYKDFTVLVDRVAGQGESIAVQLQKKIQKSIRSV